MAISAGCQAATFPLFQAAVTELSGSVSFTGKSDIKRSGTVNEVWSHGETLRTGKGKNYFAKVGISDLALVSFDSSTVATLHQKSDGIVTPPQIMFEKGSCFFRTKRGNKEKLIFKVAELTVEIISSAGYLAYKKGTFRVICGSGSLKVMSSGVNEDIKKGYWYKHSVSRGLGSVNKVPKTMIKKLGKAFKKRLADKNVPVLPDRVAPKVTIVAPKEGSSTDDEKIMVAGVIDDPSISQVMVKVNGASKGFQDVTGGRFNFDLKLYDSKNSIVVVAEDENRMTGDDSVSVISLNPAEKPVVKVNKPKTFTEKVVEKLGSLKSAAVNPENPAVFIGVIIGGGILIFVGIFIVKKIISASRSTVQKASELATGIVFDRCEKCTEREYQYHLFYTTETVNSPFLRNLINNVNPMATSMMNESLESLLSTGLKWSQKAKQAENKLRVICRWCDTCKTGTLSLEHLEGDEVVKVDDYQIIHPIFIEWVRKVYD